MGESIGEKVVVYIIFVLMFGAFIIGMVGYALGWAANEKEKYYKDEPGKQSWPDFCEALRWEVLACITCNYIPAPLDDTLAEEDDLKRRKMHDIRALRPAAERRNSSFTKQPTKNSEGGPAAEVLALDEEEGGGGAPRSSSTRAVTEKSEESPQEKSEESPTRASEQQSNEDDLKDNLYQSPVEADQVSEAVGNGNASDGSTGSAGGKSVASSRATSRGRRSNGTSSSSKIRTSSKTSGSRRGTDLDSASLDRPPMSKKGSSGVQEAKG